MLTAKQIVKDQFWIVTDSDKKVGNVVANGNGFSVKINNKSQYFSSTDEIKQSTRIRFQAIKTDKTKISAPYPNFPTPNKIYNSIFDVRRGLHVFTKTKNSKCLYAAGWFVVNHNGTTEVMFCPKYIFIQRYDFTGPYKTESDAITQLNSRHDIQPN